KGFVQSLETLTSPRDKRIVVLGAGGAARAIAVELGLSGVAELTIVNRDETRGQQLVKLLREEVHVESRFHHWENDFEVPEGTEVVVNATSIGLGDATARVPLSINTLDPSMIVADVIFNPPATR